MIVNFRSVVFNRALLHLSGQHSSGRQPTVQIASSIVLPSSWLNHAHRWKPLFVEASCTMEVCSSKLCFCSARQFRRETLPCGAALLHRRSSSRRWTQPNRQAKPTSFQEPATPNSLSFYPVLFSRPLVHHRSVAAIVLSRHCISHRRICTKFFHLFSSWNCSCISFAPVVAAYAASDASSPFNDSLLLVIPR
ncbi:hypothetical protein PIB30_034156 [Stylosanthes scabra]|uniref:Uncharacterized protein n=1 Tax=Stylosanthes scabra TaxID=79078 RepID=A0ABU6XAR2_9FABA|nr:hypothetical protein [Stylosanthes scabra]